MANQLYAQNPTYAGGVSGVLTSRSVVDPYLPESPFLSSSRLLDASDHRSAAEPSAGAYYVSDRAPSLFGHSDASRGSALGTGGAAVGGGFSASAGRIPVSATSQASWPGIGTGVDVAASKRPSDVAYNQSVLSAHYTIGQSEAWLSSNSLAKRPRFDSTSNFHIYPQRPGEKTCAHYMLTRTCKFGDSCKFDHPIWVPQGGIPDWKEVPLVLHESFPQRPGEPDCPYFLKTQQCKFGLNCKFNHPKDKLVPVDTSGIVDASALPERPFEPPCSYYMKTGKCKFGVNCKFDHPKEIQIPSAGQETGNGEQADSINSYGAAGDMMLVKPHVPAPPILYNSRGLPIRVGEVDCPFYMKTGSCKYGANCRYNHPERNGQSIVTSPALNLNVGVINPAASILQALDPRLAQTAFGLAATMYPQRPGQIECDYYMKTGVCKFGERCKFHHPIDWSSPTQKQAQQQNVKLTLAGLPRREGAVHCPFYMKTGTCKYGVACKFDHPPPGEVMVTGTAPGTSTSAEDEDREEEKKVELTQEHEQ
ncbi:hypothetical protein Nepgr_001111 [Nepenthes gracilis]|uniref:C3H1-type domain-containing protein n=1 Tax=Nepenthes gracilis TaxID=150966 RepID=A0AAD3P7Z8_NEPGR|nr:hypothetical protein Nepgr_001111 [Nepenthes gracilis]